MAETRGQLLQQIIAYYRDVLHGGTGAEMTAEYIELIADCEAKLIAAEPPPEPVIRTYGTAYQPRELQDPNAKSRRRRD